jgi:hypothetical protein
MLMIADAILARGRHWFPHGITIRAAIPAASTGPRIAVDQAGASRCAAAAGTTAAAAARTAGTIGIGELASDSQISRSV